jgi:hypothetical protein
MKEEKGTGQLSNCPESKKGRAYHCNLAVDADHNHGVERRSGAEKAHHVTVPSFRPDPVEQVDEDEADERLVQTVEHPHGDLGDAKVEVLLALQGEKEMEGQMFVGICFG